MWTSRPSTFLKLALFAAISFASSVSSYVPASWESIKENTKINLGIVTQNNIVYRGALVWDAPVTIVGVVLDAYGFVRVGGVDVLAIYKNFGERHRVKTGWTYFDDEQPIGIPIYHAERDPDFKNLRETSQGFFARYEYKKKRVIGMNSYVIKNYKENLGLYGRFSLEALAIPQFALGVTLGVGEKQNNQFLYGPEAQAGLADLVAYVKWTGGEEILPWRGSLNAQFLYSEIVRTENRDAEFVQGNGINHTLRLGLIWNIWE